MAQLVLSPRSWRQDTVGARSYTIERRGEMTIPGQHDLPLGRLEGWMRGHIDGFRSPLAAEQFAGGHSHPAHKPLSGGGFCVLRRKPLGQLLPSAHAVDRECRV